MFRSTILTRAMGISIQQYRSRIGRFLPKHSYSKIDQNTILTSEDFPAISIPRCWLFIAISVPFILALLQFPTIHHPNQSYSHPMYPTNQSLYQLNTNCDNRSGKTTTDIASMFILSYGINALTASSYSMITNFQSRYLHGNRRGNGIKICHWNKGPGFLRNKMPEIKNIINGLHPHIFGISEANLHQNHDQKLVQLDEYLLHTCPTIENTSLKTSRVVVYTHQSLVVKLRPDVQ
jgi:hypothetical protein